MAFSWGSGAGDGNQGESPASSGSGATNEAGGAGHGFWLGTGTSDRSEDESDGGYGLFNNDYAGFSNVGGSEGLSMDFWNIEDIKPMNLGGQDMGTGLNGSSRAGISSSSYEDPLLKARKDMLLGSSPDAAMDTFDDLAGIGVGASQSLQANSAFKSPISGSNVFGLYSGNQQQGNTPQGLDPNALFGSGPSSAAFASPSSSSSTGGINLQDLLGGQSQPSASAFAGFSPQGGMIGGQQQQSQSADQYQQQQQQRLLANASAGTSSLLSPPTFFQQLSFSSGTSNPTNSGSSRDSSSDPPGAARRESTSIGDTGNYTQASHMQITPPSSNDQTASSSSTTRISTAANSPPGQNVGLRQSKSGSSLVSQPERSNFQMSSSYGHSGTNMLAMPDKVSQQQAAETTSVVKHVTRDAAIRSKDGTSLCQLLVLGLPDEGARSRVETQVKVGLILLRPKAKNTNQTAMNHKDPKGALLPSANDHFDKVGCWKYLALPAVSSVKRRARKHFKASVPPEDTLFADIKVVSASNPSREIAICQNCQQREIKRQQRKTQNRSKPSGDIDSGKEDEEGLSENELAKRKIVLFNCGQYLEFNNGETVIPTRITCYCRHHKEKYGFTVTYTLTDHLGQVVATAMSPPIFLTDDHKAKPTKPENIDLTHIASLARVANGPNGTASQQGSAWNSAASSMPSSAASSQASSAASSAVPSRSNSVENLEELHHSSGTSGRTRKDRSAKPYNLDSRPHKPKKNSNLNRLNSFTMTPLNLSAPGSPRLPGPSPLTSTSQLPTDYLANSSAPLQSFSDMLQSSTAEANNLNTKATEHQSPNSSLSAPSTPGATSLESYSTSIPSQAGFQFAGPGSFTSNSDEFASVGSRSLEQSPLYPNMAPLPQLQQSNLSQHLASLNMVNPGTGQPQPQAARPRISRIIPNEGPTHGGTEVIILGENFTAGLEVTFGDTPAVSAQAWGGNTLVCILPPSPSPGPVVVAFKNLAIAANDNSGLQLFTYVDTSDKALMELALQVVGMKMSGGRIEDARNVARRIIGAGGGVNTGFPQMGISPQQASSVLPQGNRVAVGHFFASNADAGTRGFQAMIIKMLAVLDVDYCDSSPQLPANPVDHVNEQKHTLMHLAAVLGFHRLVSWLIERDASLDMQDELGYTPLHLAALCGRVTITRLLLQAGALHNVANQAGQTPMDIARERDQIDVEALFTRHTPSKSASYTSLPEVKDQEEDESWSPPARRSRSPGGRQIFTLGSPHGSQYDSDSDSDWSNDDEVQFASESELEGHITRLSRNASGLPSLMERHFDSSKSSGSSDKSADRSSRVGRAEASPQDILDADAVLTLKSKWTSRLSAFRLASKFSQLKLPAPPSIHNWRGVASAAMSASPSGVSISASSLASTPITAPESEAETSTWPASLVAGRHPAPNKTDISGVRASLGRKLGYSIDHITEDALRSYSYQAQKYGGTLRKDKMLYIFWLPLFLIAMIWIYGQASAFVSSTLSVCKEAVLSHVSALHLV